MARRDSLDGYLSGDTIAAAATAVGGPVAIVRISGSGARAAADALIEGGLGKAGPRVLARARLLAPAPEGGGARAPIDDAMAVLFAAPASFTGEDVVELHLHGGGYTVARVLGELAALGVRQALPGEFSFRAVRNGKMGLPEAQATADLIAARNAGAAELALEKLSGAQSRQVEAFAERIRRLATLSEVGIDFSDQDVEEVSLPVLKRQAEELCHELERLEGSFERGSKLQEGVRAAFIGLPNAGKSSFFNALLGEERSIVTEIAGTTRDVVREALTLRGHAGEVTLKLEDTAGLRHAGDGAAVDAVERIGIERTLKAAAEADLRIWVIDLTGVRGNLAELERWRRGLPSRPGAEVAVLTKADAAGRESEGLAREEIFRVFGNLPIARTSAVSGEGIEAAARAIADAALLQTRREPGELLLTRLDQAEAVRAARGHLERALGAGAEDLFASDVRRALDSLGPLIGATPADDVLGRIFSGFCIGK